MHSICFFVLVSVLFFYASRMRRVRFHFIANGWMKSARNKNKCGGHLPVIGDLIGQSILYISIQQIVWQIGRCTCHPFDRNWSVAYIKIVWEKFIGTCLSLPMEFLGNATPKCLWIVQWLRVHGLILIHGAHVRILTKVNVWFINRLIFLGRHFSFVPLDFYHKLERWCFLFSRFDCFWFVGADSHKNHTNKWFDT